MEKEKFDWLIEVWLAKCCQLWLVEVALVLSRVMSWMREVDPAAQPTLLLRANPELMHRVFGNLWMGQTERKVGETLRPNLYYANENWKRRFHSENATNVFSPHYAREIWKSNNQRSFCLELGLGKTRTGKTHDCRKVFKDLHFRKCFLSAKPAFSYFSGSKCISGKLYFYDGLVWMIGLTVQDIAVLSNFSKVVWTSPQPFAGYPLLLHFPRVCINKERVF